MQSEETTETPTIRSAERRRLDERLARYEDRVGPPPARGWVRTIRQALGMSQYDLGQRMGVSQPRIAQIERAEADGSVELATIRRIAAAMGCSLRYVLVPEQPLEQMVHRQALEKAGGEAERAATLVDSLGLWRADPPAARPLWPGRATEEGT